MLFVIECILFAILLVVVVVGRGGVVAPSANAKEALCELYRAC